MNEIITELSKPIWWVSVVVAGIVIHLLSAYLKSPLDFFLAKASSWWRNKSESRKQAWQTRVEQIARNDDTYKIEAHREIRQRLETIEMLLLAIFSMNLPSLMDISGIPVSRILVVVIFFIASVSFFIAFHAMSSAANTGRALREAGK